MTTVFYPTSNVYFENLTSTSIDSLDNWQISNFLIDVEFDFVLYVPEGSIPPPLGIYFVGTEGSISKDDFNDLGGSSLLERINDTTLYLGHSPPYHYSSKISKTNFYFQNDGIEEGTENLTLAVFLDRQKTLQLGESFTIALKDDNSGDDTIIAYPNGPGLEPGINDSGNVIILIIK